jgi:hypothetical protein
MRYDIIFLVNNGPTAAQLESLTRFLKIMDQWTDEIRTRTDELFQSYGFIPNARLQRPPLICKPAA